MSTSKTKKTSGVAVKALIALLVIMVIVLTLTFFKYYLNYFGPNVTGKKQYLYIRTGSGLNEVLKSMTDSGIVKDTKTFVWAADNMHYKNIKPGRYRLTEGMSNRKLINMLKSGSQEPVKLRFHDIRLKDSLAKFVSTQLEADSAQLLSLMLSPSFTGKYGFNKENVYVVFIPNSYEVYWNTSAGQFFNRMVDEYRKFWNGQRTSKAAAIGLSPVQVSIMASIVDAEALYNDEMPVIAGLYMNRYHQGMKLESDPTVIFANHDFTIHRVLNKQLRIPSPYNTYLHTGLPPGPIMMPSIKAIDAVLNYQHNNYLFMCAKEDLSGHHNFAATREQHEANAEKYRHALDARNIKH